MSGLCWTHLKPSWLGWHSTMGGSTTPMSPTPPRCRSTSAARPCNLKRFEVWGTGSNTRGPMVKSEGGMDMFFWKCWKRLPEFSKRTQPRRVGFWDFFQDSWKKHLFFLYGKFWSYNTWICLTWFLRILPWDSSPFCKSISFFQAPNSRKSKEILLMAQKSCASLIDIFPFFLGFIHPSG